MPHPRPLRTNTTSATNAVPGPTRWPHRSQRIENEFFVYDGTQHAFCNDDRPEVYDEAAATASMDRTVDFMLKHLS